MKKVTVGALLVGGLTLVLAGIVLYLPKWMSHKTGDSVAQSLSVERVVLKPGRIVVTVRNGGGVPVNIAQVAINGAYWQFSSDRLEIRRLQTADIDLYYPWIRGEPLELKLVSADGQTLVHTLNFPVETPHPGRDLFKRYVPLGLGMGVLPVAAGMLLRPVLRRSGHKTSEFFLAFTIGVLLAIGVESSFDTFELSAELVAPLAGRLLVVSVSVISFAAIYEWARRMGSKRGEDRALVAAWALAVAIGLHNLGEGLAVAGAEAAGVLAVGGLLALGFAVHNVSEGVAIAAVAGKKSRSIFFYQWAAAIAGLPALGGLLIGSLTPSKPISVALLAVGLGAIAEVVAEVWGLLTSGGGAVLAPHITGGLGTGLAFMYFTSIFVA